MSADVDNPQEHGEDTVRVQCSLTEGGMLEVSGEGGYLDSIRALKSMVHDLTRGLLMDSTWSPPLNFTVDFHGQHLGDGPRVRRELRKCLENWDPHSDQNTEVNFSKMGKLTIAPVKES